MGARLKWGGEEDSQTMLKKIWCFEMNPATLWQMSFCLSPAVREKETLTLIAPPCQLSL